MKDHSRLASGKGDRQSSLELLRILCMLLIVAGHSVMHGGFDVLPLTANGLFATALTQGSRIGVDIFVLLSVYFSVNRGSNSKKIKILYVQIWTYSVVITAVMAFIGAVPVEMKRIISALLPISTSQYWFATCYVLLLLAGPAIQTAAQGIDKKTYQKILFAFFLLWSVLPTLHIGTTGFSNFGWFVFLFFLAAYIRRFPMAWMDKIRIWHGVCCYVLIIAATIITYALGSSIRFFKENAVYLYGEMNAVPAVLCACLLLLGFKNLNIKQS